MSVQNGRYRAHFGTLDLGGSSSAQLGAWSAGGQPGSVTHNRGASLTSTSGSTAATVDAPAPSITIDSSRQACATGATRAVDEADGGAELVGAGADVVDRQVGERAVLAADVDLLVEDPTNVGHVSNAAATAAWP